MEGGWAYLKDDLCAWTSKHVFEPAWVAERSWLGKFLKAFLGKVSLSGPEQMGSKSHGKSRQVDQNGQTTSSSGSNWRRRLNYSELG